MASFAERYGHRPKPTVFQLDGMTDELRNSLWNTLYRIIQAGSKSEDTWRKLVRWHYIDIKQPMDEAPEYTYDQSVYTRKFIQNAAWFDVYDFFEKIFQNPAAIFLHAPNQTSTGLSNWKSHVERFINLTLAENASGYKFMNGQFVPITNETELIAIDTALDDTSANGLQGAKTHIEAAISMLSAKPSPDYRNSIKESISAVESVAKILSGTPEGGLSKALGGLSKRISIHGGLVGGMNAIYGYTSDADGIRHPILDDGSVVDLTDAKYMLVSCSAFVSYLVSKGREAGLIS